MVHIGTMHISIAICCLSASAVLAQEYPVSGVWVAVDGRTPGSAGGACFTLKLLGIDSIMDGSLPTVENELRHEQVITPNNPLNP